MKKTTITSLCISVPHDREYKIESENKYGLSFSLHDGYIKIHQEFEPDSKLESRFRLIAVFQSGNIVKINYTDTEVWFSCNNLQANSV